MERQHDHHNYSQKSVSELKSDCDSLSPALLDLFISSDASICSIMAFPPSGNFDHVLILVFFDFPSNSKGTLFIAQLMTILGLIGMVFMIIWEVFHWRITWCFCCWYWILWLGPGWIDVSILHCKYQVKPRSCLWFSVAFATAIAHRNHFFRVCQQNKSSESKVKFRQASNCFKRVL